MDRERTDGTAGMETRDVRMLAGAYCPDCRLDFTPSDAACPQCGRGRDAHVTILDSTALDDRRAARPAGPSVVLKAKDDTYTDFLIGQKFAQYDVDGYLGAGAMGRVYLARHQSLQRFCALKVLPPSMVDHDIDFLNRFRNEGRAAAALAHPNIITVHALGESQGLHYLEMEFVPGRAVGDVLREEGALAPTRATTLILKVAEGLAAAHQAGILHRDLKPDNVLLTHAGIPKIGDFGLAHRPEVDGIAADVVGTPAYMAPELFEGVPASPSSDVYALGVMFYQLLTGRVPYEAETLVDLRRLITEASPPPLRSLNPHINLEIAECVHRLMAPTPENRPHNAWEAVRLIDAILGREQDLGSLIERAFQGQDRITWSRLDAEERYRVEIRFPNGRQQTAFVEPTDHAALDRLVKISSLCCPACPMYLESALKLNSEILHGALAIRNIDGVDHFVMLDTYPRGTIDAEELRRSLLEVAHRADAIEKLLTGQDFH